MSTPSPQRRPLALRREASGVVKEEDTWSRGERGKPHHTRATAAHGRVRNARVQVVRPAAQANCAQRARPGRDRRAAAVSGRDGAISGLSVGGAYQEACLESNDCATGLE